MVTQLGKPVERERVAPWWEHSKVYKEMWRGPFFDSMILSADDDEEQRIQTLRENCLVRPGGKRGYLSICRARLMTDSYKQTEGEAPVLRKAKAFRHVCEHIPIPHQDGQLLMGDPVARVPGIEVEPEFHTNWLERDVFVTEVGKTMEELDALKVRGVDAWMVDDEDTKILKEYVFPFWRGICNDNFVAKQLSENFPEVKFEDGHFVGRASYPYFGFALNHTVASYVDGVRYGLRKLSEEIRTDMDKIDGSDIPSNYDFDRKNLYKAMLISIEGIITYAHRCADLAEKMAAEANESSDQADLREIARICRKVPEYPSESWWEAIQSWHFLHNAVHMSEGGVSHCAGRFDQYMYPFLKQDLDKGGITKKRAQALLECLFLKMRQRLYLVEYRGAKRIRSFHTNDKITSGGTTVDRQDATNDLTYMLLEAHAHVHLDDPVLSLRLHTRTPDRLLKSALQVLRLGSGIPHLLNDEAITPGLMRLGIPLDEAVNYADIGCQENVTDPNTCGADTNPRSGAGWFNLPKLAEFALFNGVDRTSNKQSGIQTGDARSFRSMDEFFEAVRKQTEYAVTLNCIFNNVYDWCFANWYPTPVLDLLHPNCRKRGIDYSNGGCKHNWTGGTAIGLATVADSLSAIEYLVYDKKLISMDALLKALDSNWVGYESIQKMCLAAPKYGNDNDYADKWMVRMSNIWMDAYEKHRTPKGGIFVGGFLSMTTYMFAGNETWASVDGRKAGDPLSPGGVDASNLAVLEGPTRLHKSAAKINTWRTTNGVVFNIKFPTSVVGSERELSKWADLVKTYVLLGGQTVQYTIVNNEALKAAQIKPDDYRDLIVRTGGYSAFFVELDKETQDSIIGRAEHHF